MASPLPSAPAAIRPELDPFNAVRSPERNFGRATLPGGVRATPRARRLAAMAGIDLATINADGPHGRIVGKDIEDATLGSSSASPIQTPRRLTTFEQFKAIYDGVPFVEIKLDGMRRTIAKRLLESKQTVPHFYLTVDVDIEQMLAIRQTLNASLPSKLSLNDFVVKAFAMALIRVPLANAVWAEDRILRFARADVGIAIEVDGGLFAPVVRDANNRSLSMIAEEIRALAQRARDRKLKPHDYQGGSATVSNLGKYGVRQFFAIVAPPQSSILAVGASERRPVATVEGGIRISTQMTVTLSCDHRVVDGALGAELLATFKKIIEEPGLTLV